MQGHQLKNKVAVITGGAGGIGRLVARYFLDEGASTVVADIDRRALAVVSKEFAGVYRGKFAAVKTDVTRKADVARLAVAVRKKFGPADILVNASAVQKPIGPVKDTDERAWQSTLVTNVMGTVICCKHFLPSMISRRSGKIINFSGGGATFPRVNFSAYACSKAAIVRFTEILAEEVGPYGIEVNAVSPGPVYTGMLEDIIRAGKKSGASDLTAALNIKKMRRKDAYSGKSAALLSVFLASGRSDGITGKLISAVWDDWNNLPGRMAALAKSDLYTLRRVDGVNIKEAGRGRR